MPARSPAKAWMLVAVLYLMLLAGGIVFVRQHHDQALTDARARAERELALLSTLIGKELQIGHYALAGETVKQWGANRDDVAAMRLETANHFVLGEYRKPGADGAHLTLETPIRYALDGNARLLLSKDLSPVLAEHRIVVIQLVAGLAMVAVMLAILTRLQLLYLRESADLKVQMARADKALQALRESEQRYRIQVEHAPEAITVIDLATGLFVEANENAMRLFGLSREEILRHSPFELSAPIQPDGQESARLAEQRIQETLDGGNPVFEWLHRNAAGQDILCEVRLARMPDAGRVLIRGSITDITQRKADEAKLRQDREQQTLLRELMETTLGGGTATEVLESCLVQLMRISWLSLLPKAGIFLMEQDGQSLRLTASHGLAPQLLTLCARVPLGRCQCGRAADSAEMRFSACLDHEHEIGYPGMEEHGHYNIPLISDGRVLGVLVLYLPHGFSRNAAQEQFLATVADILAGYIRRQQAEAALKHLNEELEDRVALRTAELVVARDAAESASRAKSEFLSRMSHELRTPLNAILGFGQLLELDVTDPAQADSVSEILHAGQHLLELINEVLDLARIESGKLRVEMGPVPLKPLLDECLGLIQPLADRRGIQVAGPGPACDVTLLADRTRLKQALLNLLSNAAKYNRDRGNITVSCARETDQFRIRVSDTGAGLAPEQLGKLFVPFERLDADKNAIEGTGIGLALSKRHMELMGGGIGVESRVGEGSTFWIELPLAGNDDLAISS